MGIFDRIDRWFLARINRDLPHYTVGDDEVRVHRRGDEDKLLPYSSLVGALVYHQDVYAADAIVLLLTFAEGAAVVIDMEDPQWPNLVTALDRSGRLKEPSKHWQLDAMADGPDAAPRELMSVPG